MVPPAVISASSIAFELSIGQSHSCTFGNFIHQMKDHQLYRRFWFEFAFDSAFNVPFGIGYGCGVTAIDLDDAIKIMNRKIFTEVKMPQIKRVVEDVDIRTLDQGHVIPNMKAPIYRGIWFPIGYDH